MRITDPTRNPLTGRTRAEEVTKERARFERLFPLLHFTWPPLPEPFTYEGFGSEKYGAHGIAEARDRRHVEQGHMGTYATFDAVNFGLKDEGRFSAQHHTLTVERDLEARYPHLRISYATSRHGFRFSVWVKRDGRDHEAMASDDEIPHLHDPAFHPRMEALEAEAAKATAPGWFFCSGHRRAEPVGEGRWHHFAGRYCETWGEEHPGQREAARRETYE